MQRRRAIDLLLSLELDLVKLELDEALEWERGKWELDEVLEWERGKWNRPLPSEFEEPVGVRCGVGIGSDLNEEFSDVLVDAPSTPSVSPRRLWYSSASLRVRNWPSGLKLSRAAHVLLLLNDVSLLNVGVKKSI